MTDTNRPLRVFLCHSSADKPAVRELYQKLCAEPWLQPWLDEEELYPGQDWDIEIQKAVEDSDVVIVCLSNSSITKRGYIQKELRYVVDIALEIPEEEIFIIPLRLEECTPPRSLRDWQYADYFPEEQRNRAIQRLLVSLKRRAVSLGLTTEDLEFNNKEEPFIRFQLLRLQNLLKTQILEQSDNTEKPIENEKPVIEMLKPVLVRTLPSKITLSNGIELLHVPAGKFLMGSEPDNIAAFDDEKPQHYVDVPYDYWMAQYPVTNESYSTYAESKRIKHPVDGWERKKDHPVVYVEWTDAMAYCRWLNNLLKSEIPSGLVLRLPTEAEWEKAARGEHGNEWPWGNEFNKNKCNSSEGGKGGTTPAGSYSPRGDSPYGCADMVGNVHEWTHSLKSGYPYKIDDGREDEIASGLRGLRGGSFHSKERHVRCAHRLVNPPLNGRFSSFGFRVALAPKLPE